MADVPPVLAQCAHLLFALRAQPLPLSRGGVPRRAAWRRLLEQAADADALPPPPAAGALLALLAEMHLVVVSGGAAQALPEAGIWLAQGPGRRLRDLAAAWAQGQPAMLARLQQGPVARSVARGVASGLAEAALGQVLERGLLAISKPK